MNTKTINSSVAAQNDIDKIHRTSDEMETAMGADCQIICARMQAQLSIPRHEKQLQKRLTNMSSDASTKQKTTSHHHVCTKSKCDKILSHPAQLRLWL